MVSQYGTDARNYPASVCSGWRATDGHRYLRQIAPVSIEAQSAAKSSTLSWEGGPPGPRGNRPYTDSTSCDFLLNHGLFIDSVSHRRTAKSVSGHQAVDRIQVLA